ncbi:hypothetical protein AGMMS50255_6440 [Spirochaetia bacterium]|nr:hypothetical protein AGMMS50255_6440 [Spirochaetia bacterium]
MKRFVSSAFVLMLCAVSLMAGGNSQPSSAAGPARPAGKQDPFVKYSPEITLTTVRTMSSNDKFDTSDPEKRSYEENRWIRVIKEDLGINVKYNWLAPDADSSLAKWNANIAARDIPDFAVVDDNVYKLLYEADLIADMGQILEDYSTEEYRASLVQADYEMMTMDGQMWGFPGAKKALSGTTVLYVRQDWLNKVGLQVPQTIDEVINVARAFRNARLGGNETVGLLLTNNFNGGSNHSLGDGKWDGFLNGYGAYINYWLVKDGKLAYSTVQPEWRPALLKMQEIYKEGLVNRDFPSVTTALAREMIASGKVGIFYSNASAVIHGINTLIKTDPNAKIVHVFPPPAVRGQMQPVQTNSPKGMRIFVSKNSQHPEGVVKMAMLAYHARFKDAFYYYEDQTGFPYYKYLPFGDTFQSADDDLLKSAAVRDAELNGKPITDVQWLAMYDTYKAAKEGKAEPWNLNLYGPAGTFSTLYDSYKAGLYLLDAYNGLPTDTMALKGGIINAALQTAIFEVVMGADISTYDRAVERWYADGGTQIVNEVNRWYQGLKK